MEEYAKIYKRKITNTQAKHKICLVDNNVNQQCSYNLPLDLYSYLKEINALKSIKVEEDSEGKYDYYELSNDFDLELGENIYIVIGNKYKKIDNKIIFTHTIDANGKSNKLQLKRVNFLKRKDERYNWFVYLYDMLFSGAVLVFTIKDNKKVKIDIDINDQTLSELYGSLDKDIIKNDDSEEYEEDDFDLDIFSDL